MFYSHIPLPIYKHNKVNPVITHTKYTINPTRFTLTMNMYTLNYS